MGEQVSIDTNEPRRMTHEEYYTTRTRVFDLEPPQIDGKFPLSNEQLITLSNGKQDKLGIYSLQREQFQQANTVIAECRSIGLGDNFNHLRYGILLARKTPQKKVIIAVSEPITKIDCIDLPENAKIVTDYSPRLLDRKDTFVIKFQLDDVWDERNAQGALPKKLRMKLEEIEKEGRYATYRNSLADYWSSVAKVIGIDHEARTYNVHDLINATRLSFLGIDVTEEDLAEPIVRFSSQALQNIEQKYDLLIVPDAGEGMWSESQGRSVKAISVERWKEIFAMLPPSIRVGIVMGHEHPDYTKAIVFQAREIGVNVSSITTKSLGDFCRVVLQSKKYVGGDTGPTHIARDVIKAAYLHGKSISFRELFDESYMQLRQYGTVKGDEDGKTLVAWTKKDTGLLIASSTDIDRVDAQTIAQFILE